MQMSRAKTSCVSRIQILNELTRFSTSLRRLHNSQWRKQVKYIKMSFTWFNSTYWKKNVGWDWEINRIVTGEIVKLFCKKLYSQRDYANLTIWWRVIADVWKKWEDRWFTVGGAAQSFSRRRRRCHREIIFISFETLNAPSISLERETSGDEKEIACDMEGA